MGPRCGSPTGRSPTWRWSGLAPTRRCGVPHPHRHQGFSAPEIKKKASLRASVTSELILDVEVPDDFVLPGVSSMRGPLSCLNEARFRYRIWCDGGSARLLRIRPGFYSIERHQFDRPIASFQLTQKKLVEMMVAVQRGTLVALHLGRRKDDGTLTPEQVSFGKFDNVRNALEVAARRAPSSAPTRSPSNTR